MTEAEAIAEHNRVARAVMAAKRELLDMVAVLMREWERISDEKEVLA